MEPTPIPAPVPLTSDELEGLYHLGYGFLTNGKLDQAASIFSLLTVLAPAESRYWCALGAAQHEAGDLAQAALAYAAAATLAPNDVLVVLNQVEVWADLGELDEARRLLTTVESSDAAAHRPLRQRIQALSLRLRRNS